MQLASVTRDDIVRVDKKGRVFEAHVLGKRRGGLEIEPILNRYKVAFRAAAGDLLTVHGHRVMHGRLAFDPKSGGQHLQDVYMEYDDFMARLRVLSGQHIPLASNGEGS